MLPARAARDCGQPRHGVPASPSSSAHADTGAARRAPGRATLPGFILPPGPGPPSVPCAALSGAARGNSAGEKIPGEHLQVALRVVIRSSTFASRVGVGAHLRLTIVQRPYRLLRPGGRAPPGRAGRLQARFAQGSPRSMAVPMPRGRSESWTRLPEPQGKPAPLDRGVNAARFSCTFLSPGGKARSPRRGADGASESSVPVVTVPWVPGAGRRRMWGW